MKEEPYKGDLISLVKKDLETINISLEKEDEERSNITTEPFKKLVKSQARAEAFIKLEANKANADIFNLITESKRCFNMSDSNDCPMCGNQTGSTR